MVDRRQFGSRWPSPISKSYPGTRLESLRKLTRYIVQENWYFGENG
jgi:hypothetical protein